MRVYRSVHAKGNVSEPQEGSHYRRNTDTEHNQLRSFRDALPPEDKVVQQEDAEDDREPKGRDCAALSVSCNS